MDSAEDREAVSSPEVLMPLPSKGNIWTRVTASIRLGRGVVGNTTFGLWACCVLALVLCPVFVVCGYPGYALAALGVCVLWYLAYQCITWFGIARSPDAGVTADEDYLGVVTTRQTGAHNMAIISDNKPMIGGAKTEASAREIASLADSVDV